MCGEKLLVGILPPKTATGEYDLLPFDIVMKSESAQSQPIRAFPGRDIGKLLDRITACSVIRILTNLGFGRVGIRKANSYVPTGG